jgi:cobalt-zinc-cadmium efflux system membrane fusion protein
MTPDAVLGQVLGKVMGRDGLNIVHAQSADQALLLAAGQPLKLVLLDCGHRDGNGLKLADDLHARYADLPLILMSTDSSPAQLQCQARQGMRVLSQPLDLHKLRQAVDIALAEGASSLGTEPPAPAAPPRLAQPIALLKEIRMPDLLTKLFKVAGVVFAAVAVLIGIAMVAGMVHMPWQSQAEANSSPPPRAEALGVTLVEGHAHTLAVPDDVRRALGIRTGNSENIAVAQKPTRTRPLVMAGSTALDPTRLMRIRARFAPSPSSAEVVHIAQVPEDPRQTGKMQTVFREIRSGDRVKKADLLAVFHSVDVGNKKNDLIDAIYQLKLDEEILKKAEARADAVPEVFLLSYRKAVQGDINTINRAVNTLRTWGIPEEDIQAVRDEAENVKKREGKHDREKDALWARVEIRAPGDGVIIERNVALHEIVVDNTTNLFQIANVDKLSVFANVPEDDLPELQALSTDQRRWTVKTVGSDPIPGFIDDIGYLIDPMQHTAVVKGHIDNKQGKLRGGQFVSATVDLRPPDDVVEVPIDAVVEDGQQCVVFVQTDPAKHYYTMRRVELTNRFDKTAFVRSKPFASSEQPTAEEKSLGILPKEPLRPGERILPTAVGELKAALLDKESQPEKKS